MRQFTQFIVVSAFDRLCRTDEDVLCRSYTGTTGTEKVMTLKGVRVLTDTAVFTAAHRMPSHTQETRLMNVKEHLNTSAELITLRQLYRLTEERREDTLFVFPASQTVLLKRYLEDLCKSHNAVYRFSEGSDIDRKNREKRERRART